MPKRVASNVPTADSENPTRDPGPDTISNSAPEAASRAMSDAAPDTEAAAGSSTMRSLGLLSLLAKEGRALSLADLAMRLALPKGTTHRICSQLLASGFLVRDVDERSFTVGPALRQLALDTLNHGVVRGLRHEVLAELVEKVGETCNFTSVDGTQVIYLDRVEARWPLRLTLDVGSQVPMHCTASGKLFLAHMPKVQRDNLIEQLPRKRMTRNTLVSAAELRAECERIAEQGYACDREEFIAGLVALAVPVPGADGSHRAAIAVHGPVARFTLDDAIGKLPAMQTAARRMQRLL